MAAANIKALNRSAANLTQAFSSTEKRGSTAFCVGRIQKLKSGIL